MSVEDSLEEAWTELEAAQKYLDDAVRIENPKAVRASLYHSNNCLGNAIAKVIGILESIEHEPNE